nr:MAG TPA: hypothetical protein [Caudoviricetes sp.]
MQACRNIASRTGFPFLLRSVKHSLRCIRWIPPMKTKNDTSAQVGKL